MDQSRPKGPMWTKVNQIDRNGLKFTKVDLNGSNDRSVPK